MEKTNPVLSSDLEAAKNQFENWRSGKRSSREPIPQNLWETAIALSHKYSIYKVSKCLRLNFTDLKKRFDGKEYRSVTRRQPETFIELPWEKPGVSSECIIEMEDEFGCRMKMCFRGETRLDLLELGKSFWNKTR
ncbi:MAG: hypothetical protein JW786_12410 [Desulfobacterales bacterium]|nr:hypothetical protein [Desulfobacterales bacterium]